MGTEDKSLTEWMLPRKSFCVYVGPSDGLTGHKAGDMVSETISYTKLLAFRSNHLGRYDALARWNHWAKLGLKQIWMFGDVHSLI